MILFLKGPKVVYEGEDQKMNKVRLYGHPHRAKVVGVAGSLFT
jgi:hypothetical protein